MGVNLFSFVGMFDRQLAAAGHLLDKGAAHLGDEAEAMLDWRLVDDMLPLRFQLRVVIEFARNWPARAAGLEPAGAVDTALDIAGFRTAIGEARAWLATLTPDQFAGRDAQPLTVAITAEMVTTMTVEQWITGFATTNLYFHLSTIYAILRARGVPIGKPDLFAGAL